MENLISSAPTLALLVLVGILLLVINRQDKVIEKKEQTIQAYRMAEDDDLPTYQTRTTKEGFVQVYRCTLIGEYLCETHIKTFAYDDPEFNQAEAEELIDKLEE